MSAQAPLPPKKNEEQAEPSEDGPAVDAKIAFEALVDAALSMDRDERRKAQGHRRRRRRRGAA